MMAFLVEFGRDGGARQQWRLDTDRYYSLGRNTCCSIVLPHISVSRQHAVLKPRRTEQEELEVELLELGAVNGTFVNGKRVKGHTVYRLNASAKLCFGENPHAYKVLPAAVKEEGVEVLRPRSCSPPTAAIRRGRRSRSLDRDRSRAVTVTPSGSSSIRGGSVERLPRSPSSSSSTSRSRSRGRETCSLSAVRAPVATYSGSSANRSSYSSAKGSACDEKKLGIEREEAASRFEHRAVGPSEAAGWRSTGEEQKEKAGREASLLSSAKGDAPGTSNFDGVGSSSTAEGGVSVNSQGGMINNTSSSSSCEVRDESMRLLLPHHPSAQAEAASTGGRRSRWNRRDPSVDKVSTTCASGDTFEANEQKEDGVVGEDDVNLTAILAGIQAARRKREAEKQAQKMQEQAAAAAVAAANAAVTAAGGSGLSVQEKRRLLWGKKRTAGDDLLQPQQSESQDHAEQETDAVDPNRYVLSFGSDTTKKSKFLKLMGHKGDPAAVQLPPDTPAPEAHLDPKHTQRINCELELQYLQGIRRKDGRKTGLGL